MSTPDSSQQYYLRLNGENVGPYFEEQIREMLRSGQVAPSELVWKEGMAEWLPCSTVFGEVNAAAPQPAPAAPVPPPLPQEVKYTVSRDGKEIGSFTEAAIRDMLKRGELPPHALVWKEGMAEWQPCSAVFKSSAQDIAQQVAQSAEVLSEKAGKALDACKTKWQDLSPKVQKAMGNKSLVKMGAIGAVAFVLLAVLGYCVLWPSEINFERELQRVQKAAENGKATAQNEMGVRYALGLGVKKDGKKAAQYFLEAAREGNAYAQLNLAFCYSQGVGVSSDGEKVEAWAKKAVKQLKEKAESGQAEAQYVLSFCYENGIGVSTSKTTAAKWLKKAVDHGYDIAQIASLAEEMDKSRTTALKKARQYGEQGNAFAKLVELDMSRSGEKPFKEKDADKMVKKALRELRQRRFEPLVVIADGALYMMMMEGLEDIGRNYEQGRKGLPQSDSEAFKWYRLAAELGHPDAMASLGKCYVEGVGVSEDTDKGLEWIRKGASLGSSEAKELFRKIEGRDYDDE
ncbi:MAG: SEL1-like repeat protein [Akkermansiaceae bacterium]|nr:SEL1-like repeat protein [Akkermansiaceae bacterium]